MENLPITTAFIQDKRRPKADGTYPVKLRLIFQRKNRLFGTVYSLNEIDFKLAMGGKPRGKNKILRQKLDAIETKACKIIEKIPEFTFDAFAEKWYENTEKKGDPNNVFFKFQEYIDEMERANRIGNAIAYRCALTSLKKYAGKDSLTFDKVTVKFLKEYEAFMINKGDKKKGNSLTTVGIYLRCLRAIFNNAVATGIASSELYPFGSVKNKKYSISTPQNIKKALTMLDIKKIFDYKPKNDLENKYRDLWVFSYLCNGANMKDICLLKFNDISGDSITFRRAKTATTSRNTKPITATYTEHLRHIVERWGNDQKEPSEFIFPFLQQANNEKRIKELVAEVVKQVNKYIKRIALECGIPGNVTTYTARHSFATTLRNASVNVSFISESLGHKNIATTENYLAGIEDDTRKEIAELLTKF